MALDGTYSGLQASVADFLNRSDLTAAVPDFIVLAEAQMHRRLIGRQRQGLPIPRRLIGRSTDSTIVADDEYIAVPDDFSGPISFMLTDSDGIVLELNYLDSTNVQPLKTVSTVGRRPAYYTVVGSEFQIWPAADQTYTGELTYIKRWPALSASNQATNWILQDYPDAYLYGALVQSAPYLKDDGRITTWGTLFTASLDDICNSDPMPSDKSTLRTEFPQITRPRCGYDIRTDG